MSNQRNKKEIDAKALENETADLAEHPDQATAARKNAWIINTICDFEKPEPPKRGNILIKHFAIEFRGWKKENFNTCNKRIARILKDYLITGGVKLPGYNNTKISKRFVILVITTDDKEGKTNIQSENYRD